MFISKGNLQVWRNQKCIAVVRGTTPHPVWVCKLPRFMGGSIRPGIEICKVSGLQIPMVPHLHQSNCYIKRKIRVWIAQKCFALVSAETVLTSAGQQTTPFNGGQYGAGNGNMRNFGPSYPHCTVFAPKQWLYQKEGTSMESTKIYYHTRCKKPYLPLQGRKLFCFIGGSIGLRMGICETLGLLIPMVPHFHRTNVYIKWKLRVWRSQKGIALVGAETVLISAGPQTTPFHEGSIGSGMQICETSGLRIPMVTHLH